jgi:hypothetical protein
MLVLAGVYGTPPVALAQSSASPQPGPARIGTPTAEPDYPIPNGYFYTAAAPGQNGAGYRVANEAGIPLWDAYKAAGGTQTLGYPLTRRFTWNGTVVQAFQNGVLRWLPTDARAEIRTAAEVGPAPADAKRAEPPLSFSGESARPAWSGWWWPANDLVGGPRLFDPDGPLARFDRYVESLGHPAPNTLAWERAEVRFAGLAWAGHCNGWAAASLLEIEPTQERVVNGVTFSVADQKGLLSSYHFADSAAWAAGSFDKDVEPADFHRELTRWIGGERKGLIFTFRPFGNDEVWSYPASKFETVIGPDPVEPDRWHVKTTVWLTDNDVLASFVGNRPWPGPDGKVLEYTLIGDPYNPNGGAWGPRSEGRFGRPFMIWYPDPINRNIDRQLTSPGLEYRLVRQITRGVDPKPLFSPILRPLLPVGAIEAVPDTELVPTTPRPARPAAPGSTGPPAPPVTAPPAPGAAGAPPPVPGAPLAPGAAPPSPNGTGAPIVPSLGEPPATGVPPTPGP